LSVLPRSLTPATGARTTRFDRPQHYRSSRALSAAHELLRPAISCAHDIVASTRGGIRESIVVICPTAPAADWHDGQIAHEAHAKFARRAVWASRPGYGQPLRAGAGPCGQCPRSRRLLLPSSKQANHAHGNGITSEPWRRKELPHRGPTSLADYPHRSCERPSRDAATAEL
jgi:hypothetical protein